MTQKDFNLLKRMVDTTERKVEATERIADYLTTIAHVLQEGKYFSAKIPKIKRGKSFFT